MKVLWRIVVVHLNIFTYLYVLSYYGSRKAINLLMLVVKNPVILLDLKFANCFSRALTDQVFRSFYSSTVLKTPLSQAYSVDLYKCARTSIEFSWPLTQEPEAGGEPDLVSWLILHNVHHVVHAILRTLDSIQLLAARDVHPTWRHFIGLLYK